MAKVRFYLQNPKAETTYIRLTFHYSRLRLVYYPGESVEPKHWNATTERMRKNTPGWQEVNAGLDRLEHLTLEIWRRYRNEGKALPLDLFRAELNAAWKGAPAAVAKPLTLFEFWQTLIDERKYSGNYAPNTYKGAQTALHKLQAFAASTRRRVDFDTINLEFHAAFVAYMTRQDHSPNFVHKVLAVLKMVMNEGLERGIHSNLSHKSRKFTVKTYQPEHVYLNEGELERLAELELTPKLARVRDLFLIGCYTGLRFSDYSRLRPENLSVFDSVPILTIETRKTKRRVYVPILTPVQTVLKRNGGKPPVGISNQKMNEYLKELCRRAGIVEKVPVVKIQNGQRVEVLADKCDLVSTHTARRSYASNEYLRAVREGRSFRPIMDILGMSKEATFLRYVKVDRLQSVADWAKGR